MSDFSELCPLFTSGMYGEITFSNITMTAIAPTHNALVGALTLAANPTSVKFQRSVIVTKVFARMDTRPSTAHILLATRQAAIGTAALTAFASIKWSVTVDVVPAGRYVAMTQASNKNFNAADCLGFSSKTAVATKGGKFSFIVRYKDR